MNSNYYFETTIFGQNLKFKTGPSVFSPKNPDPGTMSMLEIALPYITPETKLLDLGCGYGLVGIFASAISKSENILMSDISPEAISLSKFNAALNNAPNLKIIQSTGFSNISDSAFDIILSNPPYHVDFSVPKEFIEKGFDRLKIQGKMLLVTKRLDWYKNKLSSIFGGAKILRKDDYFIFIAEKRSSSRANPKKR